MDPGKLNISTLARAADLVRGAVSKRVGGPFLGRPYSKSPTILGPIMGVPDCWKAPYRCQG